MSSTEQVKGQPVIDRRTVVRGAAWSVPVIAVAVATPLAAASTALCDCFVPVAFGSANTTVITFNPAFTAPNRTTVSVQHNFGVNGSQCQHSDLSFYIDSLGATLTMSDGQTYTGTVSSTTSAAFQYDAIIPGNIAFTDVFIMDGDYDTFHGQPPMRPTLMTVTVRFRYDGKECTGTFSYPLTLVSSSGEVRNGAATLGGPSFVTKPTP